MDARATRRRHRRLVRRGLATVVVAGLTIFGTAAAAGPAEARPAAAPAPAPPAFHDAAGIHVVSVTRADDRLVELTLTTPALVSPTKVRILLPVGYDTAPTMRYPVLYLLNGHGGSYLDWTGAGDATATTAPYQVITVMPDGGRGGFYANWINFGKYGQPMWETYHIDELLPFVDANLRTIPKRQGRAIAGLSMGGFGAMSYAARHPDRFIAAASFSGALDVSHPAAQVVVDVSAADDGAQPGQAFGFFADDPLPWYAHDPTMLASNLGGLRVASYVNEGSATGDLSFLIEHWAYQTWQTFNARLTSLGIAHDAVDYGPGSHEWANWRRGLRDELPKVMAVFAQAPADPTVFTYRTGEVYSHDFGWTIGIVRPKEELADLTVFPGAFALTGSGVAEVATPGRHRTTARCRATIRVDAGAPTTSRAPVDARGRIHVAVNLGPSVAGDVVGRHTAQVRLSGHGCT